MRITSLGIALGSMITLVSSLSGCDEAHSSPEQKPAAATVVVSQPIEEEITDYFDFTGRTEAKESVDIRARVTGFLKDVLFKDGDEVKKNAPLFDIDDREYKADLKAAQGSVGIAKANQQRAQSHFERMEILKNKKTISLDEFEKAEASKKEADASVQSAEAKEARAQLNVEFSKIAAPIDGKISRSRVTAGNLVNADSTLLTSIVSVEPIYVYFDVPERTLQELGARIRQGELQSKKESAVQVLMGLSIDKGFPHVGTIDFLENRVDAQTSTVRVRGSFKNPKPEKGNRILEAGQFARIRVPIGKPRKALLVTERAIGTDQGQKFLYVVNEKNEVVFRPVELGAMHNGLRLVSDGLAAGEKVIIDGLQRVRPGSIVDPKQGEMRGRPKGVNDDKPGKDVKSDDKNAHETDKKPSPTKSADKH